MANPTTGEIAAAEATASVFHPLVQLRLLQMNKGLGMPLPSNMYDQQVNNPGGAFRKGWLVWEKPGKEPFYADPALFMFFGYLTYFDLVHAGYISNPRSYGEVLTVFSSLPLTPPV